MYAPLQIAMFLASLAVIAMAVSIVPLVYQLRSQKTALEDLVRDGRELVRNVNELSKRADRQMDDVGRVVGIARRWTERADRLAEEIGSAIEPPVYLLVRQANLLSAGTTAFLETLLDGTQYDLSGKEKRHA